MKKFFWLLPFLLVTFVSLSLVFSETTGVKKKRPLPDEYGNIVINNYAEKNKMAPVVFRHWLYRSKYTCRACHVDIGFAMEAGGTKIKCDDIKKGFYCGACHNGKVAFALIEKGPSGEEIKNCDRCHSLGKDVKFKYDFYKYTAGFPRERFGNGIDWEKAEDMGLIKLQDQIPGVSIKRNPLSIPKDYVVKPKVEGLPNILFSHKKHDTWMGCEGCHPELFGVKPGSTKYSMEDIFAGRFCGQCHGKVSWPLIDCQRCHATPVGS
ncbi:MAG: c(7)-type cytochrome triheme domain-containing protein [Dissulfurispiraceae bacterium]